MALTAEDIDHIFRKRFYYDLAGFSMENQIHGMSRRAGPERMLYGSDYPYTPASSIAFQVATMDKEVEKMWSAEEIKAVYESNARRLFA
jgi:predicted TIM-barrel fold metal-dependent hydrolase